MVLLSPSADDRADLRVCDWFPGQCVAGEDEQAIISTFCHERKIGDEHDFTARDSTGFRGEQVGAGLQRRFEYDRVAAGLVLRGWGGLVLPVSFEVGGFVGEALDPVRRLATGICVLNVGREIDAVKREIDRINVAPVGGDPDQ